VRTRPPAVVAVVVPPRTPVAPGGTRTRAEQALGTEPEGAPSEPDVEPEIDTDFGAGAHDPVTDDDDDDHDDHDDDAADDDGFGDTSAESGGVDLTSVEDVTTDVGFPTVEEDAGDVPLMVDADDTAPHDPGEPDVPE
jgi:hypothetical protein